MRHGYATSIFEPGVAGSVVFDAIVWLIAHAVSAFIDIVTALVTTP